MNIRSTRRSDIPQIAAVQAESWKDTYSNDLPQAYLNDQLAEDIQRHWNDTVIKPEDVALVAEEDGIVGFIAVWCRAEPYIDNLHVKSSERSKGVGTLLMKAAARQLIRLGHQRAYLWVVASNDRAIQFYEKLGGVCTEEALQDLFGYQVPSIKIEWSDLSVM
jgi:ribosomal protein S18 acetylase RimI-like enzyme